MGQRSNDSYFKQDKTCKNTIFVGDKNDKLAALKQLLTRETQ